MALMKCPDCDHEVSTSADSCPQCGNTDFCVRTGATQLMDCGSCHGTGKIAASVRDGNISHMACSECDRTGKTTLYQVVNLRTNRHGWQYVPGGMVYD